VLKKIVELLRQTLRESDDVIRWGGDEFILVLPQINNQNTELILKKIVHTIGNANFLMNGKGTQVTVSVGASFFQQDDESIDSVLNRCDKALYKAKEIRNTYCIFPIKPDTEETAGKEK